jgi:hypothetical protein
MIVNLARLEPKMPPCPSLPPPLSAHIHAPSRSLTHLQTYLGGTIDFGGFFSLWYPRHQFCTSVPSKRACKLKPPAKFSYEATRFFIAEKLLSFFLFTAIRRSSTQLKISLNPNLLSIQALSLLDAQMGN